MKRKAWNYGVVCPLLSVDEAAARLGCAPMDVWRLIHAGECPGLIHLGRHYIEAGRLDDVLEVLTRPGLPFNLSLAPPADCLQ